MNAAQQEQAAAALAHFFDQRVAEAMPVAFRHALSTPQSFAAWLGRACAHGVSSDIGRLSGSDADVLMVGSFSPPTLLVLLLDRRQPEAITVAARDALQAHYLADSMVKAAIKADAEGLARRAVAHLVRQRALERAEDQSLYGSEHRVPGVAPVVLSREQLDAVDDTAGVRA